MDIKTPKVGQYVRIEGQQWFRQVKVTKVTDHGVEVIEEDLSFLGPMWFDSKSTAEELTPVPDFVGTLAVGQIVELVSRGFRCKAKVLENRPNGHYRTRNLQLP